MPRPKVCLNMIVKDESKNILKCLRSVKDYIDSYLIVDTGSTDNTVKIITKFMKDSNIEGKVVSHDFSTCACHPEKTPYFDFGKNRNYAMSLAVGMGDYLMFMDADDTVVGKVPLAEMLSHKMDVYQLHLHLGEFVYFRSIFIKNDPSIGLKYRGALHEYLNTDITSKIMVFHGGYHVEAGSAGTRSKTKDRFAKDAAVFEAILEDPDCEDRARQIFYCAQSWKDHGDDEKAIIYYRMRTEIIEGYNDDRFQSYYMLAVLLNKKGSSWNLIEKLCRKAYEICPHRAETLYLIEEHYRLVNNHYRAIEVGELAVKIPIPTHSTFVNKHIYEVDIPFTLATSYYLLGKFTESLYYCEKVNTEFARNLANECRLYMSPKINAIVVLDSNRLTSEIADNLVLLLNHYKITIISDYFDLPYPTVIADDISEIEYDVVIYYDSLPHIPLKIRDNVKCIYLKTSTEMFMSFPYGVKAIITNGEELSLKIVTDCKLAIIESEDIFDRRSDVKPIILDRKLPVSLQRLPARIRDRYTMLEHGW